MNGEDFKRITRALERCDEARREAQRLLASYLPRLQRSVDRINTAAVVREELLQQIQFEVIEGFNFFVAPERWRKRLINRIRDAAKELLGQRRKDRRQVDVLHRDAPTVREEHAEQERRRLDALTDDDSPRLDALDVELLTELSADQAVMMMLVAAGIELKAIAAARGCSASKVSRDLATARDAYRALEKRRG